MGQQGLTGLVAAKRALRRRMSALRREVGAADRRAAGEAIARHILLEFPPHRARRFAVYAELADEVPMRPLYEAVRRISLPLLPRIERGQLAFAPVRAWGDLRKGAFGVLEPPRGVGAVRLAAADVVVMPGLAFDRSGHRLGRGGGFYDRAFAGLHAQPLLIGAGYAFQLLAQVPHGPGDRRVDVVAMDRGLIWSGNRT